MKKKSFIVIVILLIAIILGLCVFIAYDKNLFGIKGDNKKESSNTVEKKDDTNKAKEIESKNDYEYVGLAFSGIRLYDWPADLIGKEDGDPDKVIIQADIPKILVKTEATDKINEMIYNDYSYVISSIKNSENRDQLSALNQTVSTRVDYSYVIVKNILFIKVVQSSGSVRSGGGESINVYYYDLSNDKQLSISDIIGVFNVSMSDIQDESAESIYAIMPSGSNTLIAYYKQNSSCPSFHCMDEKSIRIK